MSAQLDPRTSLLARAELATLRRGSGYAEIDLTRFHRINDRFGHAVGDQVIRTVATRLKETLAPRRVFRSVGAAFGVELEGFPDRAELSVLTDRILAILAEPIPEIGRGVKARIGFSAEPVGDDWELALLSADRASYLAHLNRTPFALGNGGDQRHLLRKPLPFEIEAAEHPKSGDG